MKTPERIVSSPDFTHLSAYETWAHQNWLHQPGTDAAQLHARAKLDEEVIELAEALTVGKPEDIISEAGDVLWTASASGSNAGISISQALSENFPTVFHSDSISTRSVNELAMEVFKDTSLEQAQNYLASYGFVIGKNAKQWFRLQPTVNEVPSNFADAWILTKQHNASQALADITLLTSYTVQEFASSRLEEVMADNYKKIEQRIHAGVAVTKPPRVL